MRETAGNWPEEILKGRKNTKSFDHLLCACDEVILYIFTSLCDFTSPSSPPALLLLTCYVTGEQIISGWEYSSSTNSLGIQTVSTHWLLENKSGLRRELTEKGGEMQLGVMMMVEKWFSIRKKKLFSIRKNFHTETRIPSHSKPNFCSDLPFLPLQLLSLPSICQHWA